MTISEPAANLHSDLRIGVLSASKIGRAAICEAARNLGAELVVVGGRDIERAAVYAQEFGIAGVVECYADVVAHPDVEVVYNPLPNGLHGHWNLQAIAQGKHVLCEKPFAANAAEARQVHDAAQAAGVHVVEAFHYRYHPLHARLMELIAQGEIGEITSVSSTMVMGPPAAQNLRWDPALAGGSLMDVGCYAVHALRDLAGFLGGEPTVTSAKIWSSAEHSPRVDGDVEAELHYPNGVAASLRSSMTSTEREFSWRITGTRGQIFAPMFVIAHLDPRLEITVNGTTRVEELSSRSTYDFQLAALSRTIREGVAFATDSADAIATAELIDQIYTRGGWPVREPTVVT